MGAKLFHRSKPEKSKEFNVAATVFMRFRSCIRTAKIEMSFKITGPTMKLLFIFFGLLMYV
jgi:hypothetical protein